MNLGDLNTLIQSDIPDLTQIRDVYRAANRVIKDINQKIDGEIKTETAFTRIIASTTEVLTFAVASPDTIVTATNFSATVLPGDLVVIYGSAKNDGVYTVNKIATTTITLITDDKVLAEATIECTITIIRATHREIVTERVAKFTFVNTTHLITDSDSLINFEELGVADGDIIIISSADLANVLAMSIASVSEYVITVNTNETIIDDSADPCIFKIIRPAIGYQWDNENWRLTLPSYVKKVFNIYENDSELENRGHSYVNDSKNSSEDIYTMLNRNRLQLATGLMGSADDELKVQFYKEYDVFTASTSGALLDLPVQYEGLLQAGVMYYLLSKPAYKDDSLLKENRDLYQAGLKDISQQEVERLPSTELKPSYVY